MGPEKIYCLVPWLHWQSPCWMTGVTFADREQPREVLARPQGVGGGTQQRLPDVCHI